jgi:hypothetical protein
MLLNALKRSRVGWFHSPLISNWWIPLCKATAGSRHERLAHIDREQGSTNLFMSSAPFCLLMVLHLECPAIPARGINMWWGSRTRSPPTLHPTLESILAITDESKFPHCRTPQSLNAVTRKRRKHQKPQAQGQRGPAGPALQHTATITTPDGHQRKKAERHQDKGFPHRSFTPPH